jgi:hypothetical protein
VRDYIHRDHAAFALPKAALSFKCDNNVYVYDVGRRIMEPHGPNSTLWRELPKLTSSEAFTAAGVLGVTTLPNFQKTTKNMHGGLVAFYSILGITAGYYFSAKAIPDCKRESVQRVSKDLAFWQWLAYARGLVTPAFQSAVLRPSLHLIPPSVATGQ